MASQEDGWRRPLGFQEQMCYDINDIISQAIRLSTTRELTEHDVITAFVHLYRKTPNLRMTLQKRDGQIWLREMPQENIDFKVLEDADPQTMLHEMLKYSYTEGGPMWAVRFIPTLSADNGYGRPSRVEADKEYPFMSHIIFGYHHCITDGFSIMRTIHVFKGLLDDMIAGRPIDDLTQVAELIDTKHEQLVYEEIERDFIRNPQLLEETKSRYENFITDTMIGKIYSAPSNIEPSTVHIPYIFDREVTEKFHARCKSEKVTFHTAFCSVMEAAIVKLLLDSKLEQLYYQISSRHCIDTRKYFRDTDKSFGCGIGVLEMISYTPKDVLKQFWSHAKKFNTNFKNMQAQKGSFQYHVMHKLTGIDLSSRMKKADPPYKGYHYVTTNMLDVSGYSKTQRSNVCTDFRGALIGLHKQPVYWISGFQTVNGQLFHTFMYNAHLMPAEVAQKMVDNIGEIFCASVDHAVCKL